MPELPKQTLKSISLGCFSLTAIIKVICLFMINGQMESPCVAGWHINEELCNHILLVVVGLISDIFMALSIGIGMKFPDSNIGADPGSIIYSFVVGALNIGSFFPFLGMEDCKSESFATIKLVGVLAAVGGVMHIINGVVCLINLAPEERTDPVRRSPVPESPAPSVNKIFLSVDKNPPGKKGATEPSTTKNL